MNSQLLSSGTLAIVDWLAELGQRWGLPEDACRVHGLLFLIARPSPVGEIAETLRMDIAAVDEALTWLSADGLAVRMPTGWSTQADPWTLVSQALEARREREMATAQNVRRAWDTGERDEDRIVVRQARRLFDLVDDIAAIDAGARRISPGALRALIGVGGRAARLAERALSNRRRGR